MFERISGDIKEAMKAKQSDRLNVLRMLKSRLLENKTAKNAKPELDVIIQYHKQLKDSLAEYPAESEQRTAIEQELAFIQPYMPQELSETEVTELISGIIKGNPGVNFGGIMKELSPQIKGRFDGKLASSLARKMAEDANA